MFFEGSTFLFVSAESKPTKASLQLNIKAVSKSVDEENSGEKQEDSESRSSVSSPNSSQTEAKDSDIYSTGEVRSCTPPPQVTPVSCSPPQRDLLIRSSSLLQNKILNNYPSPRSPDQNGGYSSTTNGQTDTKANAVNRLSNFFGTIMNNSSSVSPTFSHSPSPEIQTEMKSSFVIKKRENGSFKSDRSPTGVAQSTKVGFFCLVIVLKHEHACVHIIPNL